MNTIEIGELVYEFAVNIKEIKEYGVSFQSLMSGSTKTPPEGVRFDVAFDGRINGPKLNGAVTGLDYLWLRADGRIELNIQARIQTDDRQHIALRADGVSRSRSNGTGVAELRENVQLFTSSLKYKWVNSQQIWATGTVDYTKRTINVKAYTA